jgi:hypothetical protein
LEDVAKGEAVGKVLAAGGTTSWLFFYACFPEPRALAARAIMSLIFERNRGEVERRAGVLAPDPARAREEAVTPVDVFDGAGGGMGSVPICVDPDATLVVVKREGIGEV